MEGMFLRIPYNKKLMGTLEDKISLALEYWTKSNKIIFNSAYSKDDLFWEGELIWISSIKIVEELWLL